MSFRPQAYQPAIKEHSRERGCRDQTEESARRRYPLASQCRKNPRVAEVSSAKIQKSVVAREIDHQGRIEQEAHAFALKILVEEDFPKALAHGIKLKFNQPFLVGDVVAGEHRRDAAWRGQHECAIVREKASPVQKPI